jgi:hypothetical protein
VKGPGIGQAVHLIAPSGATLSARVKDMSTTSFLLRLDLSETSDPFELVGDKRVSIEFTNQRGVCRIVGTAERAPGGSGLRVDATGTIELIQRRDYVRVEAFVPVTYHPDGPEGWVATAHTLDVSGNGLQITSAEGLLLGDMRRFTIELGEGEDDVHAVAAAVREAGEDSFGMRFVEIRERDRQRLVRWVFARERLARQIARHP